MKQPGILIVCICDMVSSSIMHFLFSKVLEGNRHLYFPYILKHTVKAVHSCGLLETELSKRYRNCIFILEKM